MRMEQQLGTHPSTGSRSASHELPLHPSNTPSCKPFASTQQQPLSHRTAELVPEPTPHSHYSTFTAYVSTKVQNMAWRPPAWGDNRVGVACDMEYQGEGRAEGSGDQQGSWGHFKASQPSHRSHACLDGKSLNWRLLSAIPVFTICMSVGLSGIWNTKLFVIYFYTKAKYLLALP